MLRTRRWTATGACIASALLATAAPAGAQGGRNAAVYALANGCFSLASVDRLVARDGAAYRASATQGSGAEAFRMQATALGQFLLLGRAGDLLSTDDGQVVAEREASPSAEWKLEGAGDRRFRLRLAATGRGLGVSEGRLVLADDPAVFEFRGSEGCATYPEVEINASGDPARGPTDYHEVRGTTDAHMHMMAFEFIGGKVHCGRPWHPYGAPYALVDCPDHATGAAPLESALGGKERHDPVGWPTFRDWPHPESLTHESSYYRWVERAWRGGLRVFVNLLVDNQVLCEVYPFKADRPNVCNEMATVGLQHRRVHELQDYIDAQHGGPGKGWFRIVTDPYEAREVINDGKLAVVLGIEISKLFDCGLQDGRSECDRAQVDRQLDEVHRMGVRGMELVNKFDNAFGGVAGDAGQTGVATNTGNKYETGRYWDMKTCTGPPGAEDREQSTTVPHNTDALAGNILRLRLPAGTLPVYPPPPHCNDLGLSDLGRHLVGRMMDKGMLIDPDHLSVRARNDLLSVVEERRYSGVVSSHSWSTPDAFPRIYKLGGFIAPYAGSSTTFVERWREARSVRDPRFFYGLGYGADMNGFGSQGLPRGADVPNPVTYPFRGIDGTTFARQRSGERVYDINVDGVSHYGLYPDWVEDLRKLAGDEIVEDLARGAEAYLQTWERADGVPFGSCERRRRVLGRRGRAPLELHRTPRELLRRVGQPASRPLRSYRWCVDGGGEITAAFTERKRAGLIGTSARGYSVNGVRPGMRAKRIGRRARRFARRDVRVVRSGRGHRFVFGVRRGRVTWVAVASRSVGTQKVQLRRHLRLARL